MRKNPEPPPVCPNCGADVPRKALACPHCGADEDTGWKADADYGSDSPEDEFDYEESFKREFGKQVIPTHVKPIWWITGIVLLALVVAGLIRTLLK